MDSVSLAAKPEVQSRAGTSIQTGQISPVRIPWRLNLCLSTAVLAAYAAFLFGARTLSGGHEWRMIVLLAGFVTLTPTVWGLVHEGIHGRLSHRPAVNRALSRILAILLGFSFDVVQFGHLTHHRYTGFEFDRPERINRSRPLWTSWLRHYGHLLGGHYLFTCLVATLAFAPARLRTFLLGHGITGAEPDMAAVRNAALKWFSRRERILRIRADLLLGLAVAVFSGLQFRGEWHVLVLALYGRALIYSTLDNLPHYGAGQRGSQSARNLRLPRWVSFMVLNHNLHRAHHERPEIPWRALTTYFAERPVGNYFLAGLKQFRGPTP